MIMLSPIYLYLLSLTRSFTKLHALEIFLQEYLEECPLYLYASGVFDSFTFSLGKNNESDPWLAKSHRTLK